METTSTVEELTRKNNELRAENRRIKDREADVRHRLLALQRNIRALGSNFESVMNAANPQEPFILGWTTQRNQ